MNYVYFLPAWSNFLPTSTASSFLGYIFRFKEGVANKVFSKIIWIWIRLFFWFCRSHSLRKMLSFYDAILYWNDITMESMLIWKRIKVIIFVNHPSFTDSILKKNIWWEIWKLIVSLKYFKRLWPHCAQCWYIVDAFHCLKSPPRILTRWYKKK